MSKPELNPRELYALHLIRGIGRSAGVDVATKRRAIRAIVRLTGQGDMPKYAGSSSVNLSVAFTWASTSEGHGFWERINRIVGYMAVEPLE